MARYTLTIFSSAFLLFGVQPMIGKYILPWFGGSSAVWTTCMLFFQVGLLAGYCYAHLLISWFRPRHQAWIHLVLLLGALALLPIGPDAQAWKPAPDDEPVPRILLLLLVNVGAPYLLLSSTGPLLQSWFSGSYPGRSPYRLYALSNTGSLLALLTYPFVIEPMISLSQQVNLWSWGFGVFAALCAWCAILVGRNATNTLRSGDEGLAAPTKPHSASGRQDPKVQSPRPWLLALWLALAASGSAMLLATTNQLCQEVAVIPLLWILPLSIYLLTLIICFDSPRWYHRKLFAALLFIAAPLGVWALFEGATLYLWKQIVIYSFILFACCMTCHGELVQSKPHPRYLTLFYLMVATGGALGGVFVALVAPMLFDHYYEFHVSFAGACVVTALAWLAPSSSPQPLPRQRRRQAPEPSTTWLPALLGMGLLAFAIALFVHARQEKFLVNESARNFYGVLSIRDRTDVNPPFVSMTHGKVLHGFQYSTGGMRTWPTLYFGPHSAVGLVLRHHPHRQSGGSDGNGLRVGIIGLGTGTIAAHGQTGDYIRYYEINPDVIRLAEKHFTFLSDSKADVDVVLGDARISMERELKNQQPQQFDVLIVDAFSSDAIPVHLLTVECAELYFAHLKPDGVLLLHISNRFLDLKPIARGLAKRFQCEARLMINQGDASRGISYAIWCALSKNRDLFAIDRVRTSSKPLSNRTSKTTTWTDDFAALWQVVK